MTDRGSAPDFACPGCNSTASSWDFICSQARELRHRVIAKPVRESHIINKGPDEAKDPIRFEENKGKCEGRRVHVLASSAPSTIKAVLLLRVKQPSARILTMTCKCEARTMCRTGFRQAISIMIACALTWSIGSVTTYFAATDSSTGLSREANSGANLALHQHKERRIDNVGDTSNRKVYFIGMKDGLTLKSMFSATWIQSVDTFMKMKVQEIKTVEDGCFEAFRTDKRKASMTLDWLDFSVEHMSKWWKVTKIWKGDPVPYDTIVTAFQGYVTHTKIDNDEPSPLRETLAVIPFQRYVDNRNKSSGKGEILTVASLAATLASLLKVGFGRVVVVSHKHADRDIVERAFRYLCSTTDKDEDGNSTLPTIQNVGPMEVGFVQLHDDEVKTKLVEVNVPKGALTLLQNALSGTLDKRRTQDVLGFTTDRSYWKYVYLTEPDTILQTKPWVLPQLKEALDNGMVLAPHRLQPLPHESDLIGMKDTTRYVHASGNFSDVISLDALDDAGDACCDENKGDYRPWMDHFKHCGTFWWDCGFNPKLRPNHDHLSPYSLIRLKQGTGIVSLSGH